MHVFLCGSGSAYVAIFFFYIDSSVFVLISQLKRRRHQQSAASIDGGMILWAHKYPATILQLTNTLKKKSINISLYILLLLTTIKKIHLCESRYLPSWAENVLQTMLVCCMFLDEHVDHEPPAILYFQHKFALQNGEYHVCFFFFKACWSQSSLCRFRFSQFYFSQP